MEEQGKPAISAVTPLEDAFSVKRIGSVPWRSAEATALPQVSATRAAASRASRASIPALSARHAAMRRTREAQSTLPLIDITIAAPTLTDIQVHLPSWLIFADL